MWAKHWLMIYIVCWRVIIELTLHKKHVSLLYQRKLCSVYHVWYFLSTVLTAAESFSVWCAYYGIRVTMEPFFYILKKLCHCLSNSLEVHNALCGNCNSASPPCECFRRIYKEYHLSYTLLSFPYIHWYCGYSRG